MNHKIKTVSKIKDGELSFCSKCNIYQLEYNNIYLEFSIEEFEQFKEYIMGIEIEYWEQKYASAKVKRKIPIPSVQQNLVLMFKRQEILELQMLLNLTGIEIFNMNIDIYDIDYELIIN